MSTKRGNTLHLSTTDSDENHALICAELREAGVIVPRTTVLSARVSASTRARVQSLAQRYGMTPSRLLGGVLMMLAQSNTVAPKPEDLKALRAVCAALGLSPDSNAPTIKSALIALIDAAAPPAPSDADPLAAAPDAPAAQLSRGTARRASVGGRTFTTSRGAVTLSASELESCKESGAKPEAYAENKASREAARRGRR